MTTENGRAFNEWLRAQLKAKKMSQRQLAQQSGVDHSTISRLIRGDRMPSLGTATKLARGLREIRDDADTSTALGVVSVGPQNPTARVEYALRADEALSEPQVRQIMEYYLAVRVRRFARTYSSVGTAEPGLNGNGSMAPAPSTAARRASPAWPPRPPSGPCRRATACSGRRRGLRPGRVDHRTLPGHDLNVPPRSGLGDSERRSAGAGVRISGGSLEPLAAAPRRSR